MLAGHPQLKADLRRPTLEEIGACTAIFDFEGIPGHQREYIDRLLHHAETVVIAGSRDRLKARTNVA